MKTFEEVNGMHDCMKLPIVIQAKQIHEEFRGMTYGDKRDY